VTRSISGHLTERMHQLYSTVRPAEQTEALAKVVDIMTAKQRGESGAPVAAGGAPNEETG
jgi:hypothetical protein